MYIKNQLLSLCKDLVQGRLDAAQEVIQAAQKSANEESKSSAGDKYETGRAMAQLEIEKASVQLAEARKLLQALERIPVEGSEMVRLGSIVHTNEAVYFLSIPVGALILNGETYFALSPVSPLGACLIGKRMGEKVVFQRREIVIEKVV